MVIAILGTIIAGLSAIIGGAITGGTAIVEAIGSVMTGVWHYISTFINNAPKPLKVLIFLFLLVTIGNLFSNFFLGMNYICDNDDQLYKSETIIDGIASQIRLNIFSWTIGERDDYIQESYQETESEMSPTRVACQDGSVGLFFYNINLFSYNLWILILILIYGTPMAWNYYSKTGALN